MEDRVRLLEEENATLTRRVKQLESEIDAHKRDAHLDARNSARAAKHARSAVAQLALKQQQMANTLATLTTPGTDASADTDAPIPRKTAAPSSRVAVPSS